MYSGYGYCGFYDIRDEIRSIERLSIAVDARNAMDDFIKKIIRKKQATSTLQKLKESFMKQIIRRDRLLPVGHRWRGDVT